MNQSKIITRKRTAILRYAAEGKHSLAICVQDELNLILCLIKRIERAEAERDKAVFSATITSELYQQAINECNIYQQIIITNHEQKRISTIAIAPKKRTNAANDTQG